MPQHLIDGLSQSDPCLWHLLVSRGYHELNALNIKSAIKILTLKVLKVVKLTAFTHENHNYLHW